MLYIRNIFSEENLNSILNLPEVKIAKDKLDGGSGKIYFTIPMTDALRTSLLGLGLHMENVLEIPNAMDSGFLTGIGRKLYYMASGS